MHRLRKNPWLLLGFGLAVALVSLAVYRTLNPRDSVPQLEVFTNSIGMKFVRLPPGTFLMGSPEDEEAREEDEGPAHEVTISRSFAIGMMEVTEKQYHEVMGVNPAAFPGDSPPTRADHPVHNVSWFEAMEFCRRLSELPAEKQARRLYRLPTEAEWEYACRAGTTTPFPFPGGGKLSQYCIYLSSDNNAPSPPQFPAGGAKREPNPWGLFDTCGNVREWCLDWYDADYYRHSPATDPEGPGTGTLRVVRGGSWGEDPRGCRAAKRMGLAADIRLGNGLRVVMVSRDQ